MIFYHGTTVKAAEDIRRNGLKPYPAERMNVVIDSAVGMYNVIRDEHGGAASHITRFRDVAWGYAKFRQDYEQALPNTWLKVDGLNRSKKLATTRDIHAEGAVVTFDIPTDYFEDNFVEDEHDWRGCYVSTATIPAKYVSKIETLDWRTIYDAEGKIRPQPGLAVSDRAPDIQSVQAVQ